MKISDVQDGFAIYLKGATDTEGADYSSASAFYYI